MPSFDLLKTISAAVANAELPADTSDLDARSRAVVQKVADTQQVTLQQALDHIRAAQAQQTGSASEADAIVSRVRASRNGAYTQQ